MYKFFIGATFFNFIYNKLFIDLYRISYEISTKLIDKGYLELLGPFGLYNFFFLFSRKISNAFSPYLLFRNIFLIFIFIFILINYIYMWNNFNISDLVIITFVFANVFLKKNKII